MAYTDPGAVTGGSTPVRGTWGNAVRDDLVDHESRILTLEAGDLIATVSPTNAQIKAWPTTPITLVAAPGANKYLVPIWTLLAFKSGGTGYTNINQGAIIVSHINSQEFSDYLPNDNSVSPEITVVTDFLGSADKQVRIPYPFVDDRGLGLVNYGTIPYVSALAAQLNQPLVIRLGNSTSGNLTGGAGGNAFRFVTKYSVVDLT